MIVVTIIGILAAIAIPVYTGYVTRAKVSEGIVLADPIKFAVVDFHDQNGKFPDDNAAANVPIATDIKGHSVQKVEITAGGIVVVTFGDPAIAGQTITLTPSASGQGFVWNCTSSLPPALLPPSCR